MSYNPLSPATIGNEWRVWRQNNVYVASNSTCIAAGIESTVTETIDQLLVPYTMSGAATSYGKLWAEVYNASDLGVNETPVEYTFTPNEDVAVNQMFYKPAAGADTGPISVLTNNIDQYIDELTDEVNTGDSAADFIRSNGLSAYASFAFGSAGLAAGRVLSVSFQVSVAGDEPVAVDLYNGSVFVRRLGTAQSPSHVLFRRVDIGPFYTNPLTEEPWTRADVIAMDTGTNLVVRLSSINSGPGTSWIVGALRMKVRMITEKRVAVGANTKVTTVPVGVQTANYHVLKTPAGVDNWAKAASTNYIVIVRRLEDSAMQSMAAQFFMLDSLPGTNPHIQGRAYQIFITPEGRITTAPTPAFPGTENFFGILLGRTDNALSVDSQVYRAVTSLDIGTDVSKQFMSNASSSNYTIIRAVVGVYPTLPDAPLLFKIKRASDNVQMGGTATLNPGDLSQHVFLGEAGSGGKKWYDVQLTMASAATLVSGTQYYVEMSSTGYPYWVMKWLDYSDPVTSPFTGDLSYGGSTDAATYAGAGPYEVDWLVTVTQAPPTAPASITVTNINYALPDAGDPSCNPGVHASARVTWAATSDVLFSRYEIQRSEDGGATWELIKRVSTEATVTFDDVEAIRGMAVQYRVRMVRTNGSASAWRTQTGTITFPINTQSVIFTTNTDPSLTVGYIWLGARHEYAFLSDSEVSLVRMHERDYSVQFRPLEDRGVRYTLPVLIHSRTTNGDRTSLPPGGRGADAFDPLRAVVESDGPYVAVFTPDGVRILAGLQLPSGQRIEPAAHYTAVVSATEVAGSVSVADI